MDIMGELLVRMFAELLFNGISNPPNRLPKIEDFKRPPEKSIYEINRNNSTLFVNPLEKIKVYKKGDVLNLSESKCSLIQEVQTTSVSDLVTDKKEFDYALERLMVQTNNLKGNTLQITKIENNQMYGYVFNCKKEDMK
jgi:hypothetical protein